MCACEIKRVRFDILQPQKTRWVLTLLAAEEHSKRFAVECVHHSIEVGRQLRQHHNSQELVQLADLWLADASLQRPLERAHLPEQNQPFDDALEALVGLVQFEYAHLELVKCALVGLIDGDGIFGGGQQGRGRRLVETLPELRHNHLAQFDIDFQPDGFVDRLGDFHATQFADDELEVFGVVVAVVGLSRLQ